MHKGWLRASETMTSWKKRKTIQFAKWKSLERVICCQRIATKKELFSFSINAPFVIY
jgi:hypothetical protein